MTALKLRSHPESYVVLRLGPEAVIPAWATGGGLVSITRTRAELSIVCEAARVPTNGITPDTPRWRLFEVEGPLDFSLVGILASLASPLAEARISLFAVSTYDTDYLLVPAERAEEARRVLELAGHSVLRV